jgi:hypothetical protein
MVALWESGLRSPNVYKSRDPVGDTLGHLSLTQSDRQVGRAYMADSSSAFLQLQDDREQAGLDSGTGKHSFSLMTDP